MLGQSPLRYFILGIAGILALISGYFIHALALKSLVYFIVLALGSTVLFIPSTQYIQIYFLYLGIEGCLKLISNYNPIIHVGADILIVLLWARIAYGYLMDRNSSEFQFPPLTSLFCIHFFWFLITILNPNSLSLFASLAGMKLYITIVSLYFFGYHFSSSLKQIQLFMLPWVVICVLQVATAIYQSSIGPTSVTSISPAYSLALARFGNYAFRPFGLTSQPGTPSIFVYITLPFFFYFLFQAESFIVAALLFLCLPACAVTLFICQVRSAILKGILASVAYAAYIGTELRKYPFRQRALISSTIGFSLLVIVGGTPYFLTRMVSNYSDNQRAIERSLSLFEYSSVATARSGAWDRFLLYAEQVPLGAGLSRTGAAAGKFQNLIEEDPYFRDGFFTDNLWVALLVDLGIPGMIFYTLLIGGIFILGARGFFQIRDPKLRAVHGVIFCSLFSIVLGGYGAEPLLYNPEGSFFWFFSGVLVRLPVLDLETERAESLTAELTRDEGESLGDETPEGSPVFIR